MASKSETGHAKNVEKFQILITSCLGYTTRYNPSNNKIKILNLQNVKILADQSLTDLTAQETPRKTTLNDRQILFEELPKLATRIVFGLAACEDVHKITVDDAMPYVRKIHGERKSKKILNPSPEDPKQISASQRSYANQVEFYDKLISYVLAQPKYLPNETELQETALRAYETLLRDANKAAIDVDNAWLNALVKRNETLYTPIDGLVDLALAAKKYVRSVKDITPEERKQISVLKFTRPRKKK